MTTPPPGAPDSAAGPDVHRQIAALLEIVGSLESRLSRLAKLVARTNNSRGDDASAPAPWVWFNPPTAAGGDPHRSEDPRFTVDNFVAWFNLTYRGIDGGRAKPIPDCWREHPGLAMEVACLAHSWRSANIGPEASARDAQAWHHQWRPGFSDRLARDWVPADCLDDHHLPGGPAPRADRFTLAEQHTQAPQLDADPPT